MIASNRAETLVRAITDGMRKAAEEAIFELEARGVLNDGNFQRVLAQGNKAVAATKTALVTVIAELAENVVGCLRLISGGEKIVIAATDGKETLAEATDVFPAYIDSDFKGWGLNVPSRATNETEATVYEMKDNGTFAQIFGGFGENLDRLCFTQSQIKKFCRDHARWLRTDGWATFFLFTPDGGPIKKDKSNLFVARVYVDADGREASVRRFSYDFVWRADGCPRVVLPQLCQSAT